MNQLKEFQEAFRKAAGIPEIQTSIEGDNIRIFRDCKISKKEYSVSVNILDMNRYNNGEHAQAVFPELSAEQREFIISGTTPEEWNDMFNKMED